MSLCVVCVITHSSLLEMSLIGSALKCFVKRQCHCVLNACIGVVCVCVSPKPRWKVTKYIYISTNHKEHMSQCNTDPPYPESSTGRP